jgi:redox-sensitive bicupin YhaK (pirin superfamily)
MSRMDTDVAAVASTAVPDVVRVEQESGQASSLELIGAREVPLGGPRGLLVRRTLPHRERRTVGAWCFADHFGPTPRGSGSGMHVPPHPHIGLQTVTWLLAGEVDHTDGLGSAQAIHPGELNLMTAGRGIAHAEDSVDAAGLHGLQLWVALPDAQRRIEPRFAHHVDLPAVDLPGAGPTDAEGGGARAVVFVGDLAGARSPALVHSPLLGAELRFAGRVRVPLQPDFEHAVLVVAGQARVEGVPVPIGTAAYLPPGRRVLRLDGAGQAAGTAAGQTVVVLLGGVRFTEPLLMWWNFVAREHDEIVAAREDWQSGRRFAPVTGHPTGPLPAPELPSVRLAARPSGGRPAS